MAIIPQYVNREKLITEGPQVRRNVAEEVSYGPGQTAQDWGVALEKLGEQIRKVDAANSTSKAEVERVNLEAQDEAKIKTMSAPEAEKYVEQSSQKRTQELAKKYFSDPVARQDYLRKAQVQDAAYVIQQKANIAKRVVEESDFLGKRDLNLKGNELALIFDPNKRKLYKEEMLAISQQRVQAGVWQEWQGQKYYEDALVSSLDSAIANNPTQARNELVKPDGGIYSDIPSDIRGKKKAEASKISTKYEKMQKAIIKKQQDGNYRSALLDAFDGKLTQQSVQSLYKNYIPGTSESYITDAQRGKLENYIYYNLPTTEENDLGTYNKIKQMQVEGEQPIQSIEDEILQGATQNKLTNNSAKELVSKQQSPYRTRQDELTALNAKEMREVATEFFRKGEEVDKDKVETSIYAFYNRVRDENASGNRITEIAQEIMTDTIRNEYPEINNIETVNKIKEMFGVPEGQQVEIPPPKSETQENSPFAEYPDAFKENGVWKVIRKGQKFRIEE